MKIKSIIAPGIWKAHKAMEINQSIIQILKDAKTIQNDGNRLEIMILGIWKNLDTDI